MSKNLVSEKEEQNNKRMHNPNWSQNFDYPYRTLMIGDSRC